MAISRSIRTAVGAIAVGLMFASASQAAVLIDTFNVGGFALQAPPTTGSNTITQNSLPTTDVIGGARQVSLARNSGFGFVTANMNGFGGVGVAGTFSVNAEVFNAAKTTLNYGFNSDLNANLTTGGNNSVALAFLTADFNASVQINVVSNGVLGSQTLTAAGPTTLYFNFSDFMVLGPGSIDFTDIDQIQIVLTGTTGGDYRIDLLEATHNPNTPPEAIPSPAAAWVGLTLLGSLVLRRRRAQA